MAEIAAEGGELTHERLADGMVKRMRWGGNLIEAGRFGKYCYYHIRFNTTSLAEVRILPQPETEARLVYLLKGRHLQLKAAGGNKTIARGEANCSLVAREQEQEILSLAGEQGEAMIITSVHTDFIRQSSVEGSRTLQYRYEQEIILRQLTRITKPDWLQNTYREIKLAELFVLFFEQAGERDKSREHADLRPEDIARMRKVRDILHNQPAESYSLAGLARTVGTNEASLKKNFKTIYGTTVFGYLTARRMEIAKNLLHANKLKVSAVAQEVGYKYASHFTAVFRKHFGVLPNKFLRHLVYSMCFLDDAAATFSSLVYPV